MMASVNVSYLACGFHEDCLKLISDFKYHSSSRFEVFCKVWRKMKFSLIFVYKKNYPEMLEFCEESLNIAKQFLLLSTDVLEQVGGLYLLYGLYYKIPVENIKIQVTFREWETFLDLYKQIRNEKLHDVSYIFVKLIIDNAFHYSLFEHEYGLEKNLKFRQDFSLDNPYSILPHIVEEIEHQEINNIKKLCKAYDSQKIKVFRCALSTNKLQLFNKNFMDEIILEIEKLHEKKETLSGLRKKIKELPLYKIDKHKYNCDNKIRSKLGHGFDTDSSDNENLEIGFTYFKKDYSNRSKKFYPIENDNKKNNKSNYFKEGCSEDEMY